ncbi:MAG: lipid-A-disaccharide synthase [Saprospiraceae bacterium]|nr:lipid-A-disaccharide synthase [Saprospiraceae bacterium]
MNKPFKIYIIAGEASGDYHAGMLLKALKELNPQIEAKGWGGNSLKAAGMEIEIPYEKTNFMGFVEVIKNLAYILKLFKTTKKSIQNFKPDLLLLVDYPGFNLRMAQWAKRQNLPVFYFIAPQIWAWKESRIKIIQECVQKLFVILPFEKEYFSKFNIPSSYHGHPLMERIAVFKSAIGFRKQWNLNNKSIIAILPGSRKQEIQLLLPDYLDAVKGECKYQVVIAGMQQHRELYHQILESKKMNFPIVYDDMYSLLKHSKMAMVTSGTASLETALFGVPEVVCYKGNIFSYWIALKLVKIKFIALANLIVNKKIVVELIQNECNPDRIRSEIDNLKNPQYRNTVKLELKILQAKLFEIGCYQEIAKDFMNSISTLKNER